MSKFALKALGGESGKFLSHAKNEVWLQTGNQGVGEVFNIIELPKGRVALACLGKEKGKYLSHAFAKLWLQDGIQGEGEEWICVDKGNGNATFECVGKETDSIGESVPSYHLNRYHCITRIGTIISL